MKKNSHPHEDKDQVVGEGREGNQHEWNRFDQVSANLETKTAFCKYENKYRGCSDHGGKKSSAELDSVDACELLPW